MDLKEIFNEFSYGGLVNPEKSFGNILWYPHSNFEGVELKDIVTSKESDGKFSFHLVKIAPERKIGLHIHEKQLETHEVIAGSGTCINNGTLLNYESGVISIFPIGIPHEITAGSEGLYLFAKFYPALC